MFWELLLLFITVLAVYCWKNSRSRRNLPPGPSPIFPGVGNIFQLIPYKAESSYETFNMLADVYGPILFVKFGQLNQLIIRDLAVAKEILCSDVWVDRLWDEMIADRSFGEMLGIIFTSGDIWKEMRRFSMRTLRDFGFGNKQSMESVIDDEITVITANLDKIATNGEELSMKQFFTVSILNILWSMIAGFRFGHENAKLKTLINLIDETSRNMGKATISQAYPWTYRIIKRMPLLSRRRVFIKELQQFFMDILEERKNSGEYKNGSPKDFIDAFLQAIDEHKTDKKPSMYTDKQFIMVTYDLFLAGAETTSNTLEFAILYMTQFPEVQKKVQMEIDTVIGKNRRPTLNDREKMPYTEATIHEIQRVANVLPITIRGCTQDTNVGGFDIPKGTVVGINMHGIHHSKEIWGDSANSFEPCRFLDSKNNIINTNKLLPFGLGKRVCLGETLARASLFTYFSAMLQRYEISASAKRPKPSMEPLKGFTLTPQEYFITLKQR